MTDKNLGFDPYLKLHKCMKSPAVFKFRVYTTKVSDNDRPICGKFAMI